MRATLTVFPFQCVFTAAKESFVKEQHSHNQYGLGPIFLRTIPSAVLSSQTESARLSDQANRLIMYSVSSLVLRNVFLPGSGISRK
ncbi:hypothetical protein NPIL_565981 [Nephila pilipes]|uniref:Uncharacterized protein n=1 Tax=Nephila pilipes TaxID=299642 RepID=A0A8X6R9D3_NEPPI|nr:hypothetical protein NPIL_565981 [Nephila pilipes]